MLLFNIQILKFCGESALSVYSVISNCVILFNSLFTGVGQSILNVKKSLCISLLRNVILSSAAILAFSILLGGDSLWLVMLVVECAVLISSILFMTQKQK